jgi:pimeloyl-ACP methyl ester carboxylesterase
MTTRTVRVNDVRLEFRQQGDGPTLLFVHGFPLDRSMWQSQCDSLSEHCQVIAIDGDSVAAM